MSKRKLFLFRYKSKFDRDYIAVLDRYQLGVRDGYGRGVWLYSEELDALKDAMMADPKHDMIDGSLASLNVEARNPSRHVFFLDFVDALK